MKIKNGILDFHKYLCYTKLMLIKRIIQNKIIKYSEDFPVVGVVGPRQSGKTTLLRDMYPNYKYYNLESPEELSIVENDPKSFVHNQRNVIIDEIQRFPELMSYIQVEVDERQQNGDFVISGSENLLISEKISQSLVGRAAYTTLLPFSETELKKEFSDANHYDRIFSGFYPAIYSKHINPTIYYDQYINTYVERDLRNISSITNLSLFRRFLALLAGRIGQVVNYSSLANDVGVTANTIEHWISILEACYIVMRLQPYHNNFHKRYIKSPKIYFMDTGLACNLLKIKSPQTLTSHYLIGGLFENLCIIEFKKLIENTFLNADLYYFRDTNGNEVDLIIDTGTRQIPIEIKSSGTFSRTFVKGLDYWQKINKKGEKGYVIYSGEKEYATGNTSIINWQSATKIISNAEKYVE